MGESMAPIREPVQSLGRAQIVNAATGALTLVGAAVVVKAAEDSTSLLLAVLTGSVSGWAAIWGMSAHGVTPAQQSR